MSVDIGSINKGECKVYLYLYYLCVKIAVNIL